MMRYFRGESVGTFHAPDHTREATMCPLIPSIGDVTSVRGHILPPLLLWIQSSPLTRLLTVTRTAPRTETVFAVLIL
jgi:hypothetical protein